MVRVDGSGNGSSLVRVRGLDKKYQRGSEEIHVLQGLNLDVDQGDFVAFMAPAAPAKPRCSTCWAGWTCLPAAPSRLRATRSPIFQAESSPPGGRATWVSSSRCTT